jgi:hypothetical protein
MVVRHDEVAARTEQARAIGLFRYELIREAADPAHSSKTRGRLVREIAAREHTDPTGRRRRISRDTASSGACTTRYCPTRNNLLSPRASRSARSWASPAAASTRMLADAGGDYRPVLFVLPNTVGERHLHTHPGLHPADPARRLTVATTATTDRFATTGLSPADAVWLPAGAQHRVRLIDLGWQR